MQGQRRFERTPAQIQCLSFFDDGEKILPAIMHDFSQMGALISAQLLYINRKFISIAYQNEKNEVIKMLCAIRHISKKNSFYFYGLQFVAVESRTQLKPPT